jgi:hypothetical protein
MALGLPPSARGQGGLELSQSSYYSLFDKVVELLPHRPLGLVKQDLRHRQGGVVGGLSLQDPLGKPHLSPR